MRSNNLDLPHRRNASERFDRRHTEKHVDRTRRGSRSANNSDNRQPNDRRVNNSDNRQPNDRRVNNPDYHRPSDKRDSNPVDRRSNRDVNVSRNNDKRSNRRTSPFLTRREDIHRNSPIELVVKGCRNTDSSSSDSECEHSEEINPNHRQHKRRRSEDESYEELSRRKKRIQSELNALMAEEREAGTSHSHNDKRKTTRNETTRDRDKKPSIVMKHRIKQERISDDERKKPSIEMKHRIKQERIGDDERNGRRHGRRGSPKRSDEQMDWGKKSSEAKKDVKEKDKPNFGVSGKLAEDTNTFNGVVIKYNEPKEARKPKRRWRLYPFKGETSLEFIPIHRQSAYLFGRSRLIADIPIDHPSCSKQHAVLQFRLVDYKREDNTVGRRVRPYVIDLESSNGTFVNNNKIEPRRYVELIEKDVVKFGFSSREYVILHDQSRAVDSSEEDD